MDRVPRVGVSSREKMRIGVLDILVDSLCTWANCAYRVVLKKQYASIAPQAVAVW